MLIAGAPSCPLLSGTVIKPSYRGEAHQDFDGAQTLGATGAFAVIAKSETVTKILTVTISSIR